MCKRVRMLPTEDTPGRRACPTEPVTRPIAEFRPHRFWNLSPDGRRLVTGWADRAGTTRNAFEAFIYSWISFNGWASCCCEDDGDRKLIDTLRVDARVTAAFDSLIAADPACADALNRFRSLWPIFQASQVRSGLMEAESQYHQAGRRGQVEYYSLKFPKARRAPDCHLRHGHEPMDADWAHTLEALYRVRCNLFHGTKSVHGEVDKEMVEAASAVLVPIVKHLISHPFD
jgi:hypothetical protein